MMGLTATWACWRRDRRGNLPENNSVTDRRYRAFCPKSWQRSAHRG